MSTDMLFPHTITLHEEKSDKFTIVFECMAEDYDHAEEQAINAYHNCEVINIINEVF